ncbi:MAG: hypothetical protein KDM81_02210 [Verrucomicrobiae bacterium]|nr:hypothetical protein [Verrucomicrobiae bacterium]MCP5524955.1 hypothetical protein [Verrucomicrobiales bacterium]
MPGAYITKDELAFVSHGTPEQAIESSTWTLLSGNYDKVPLSPRQQEAGRTPPWRVRNRHSP